MNNFKEKVNGFLKKYDMDFEGVDLGINSKIFME